MMKITESEMDFLYKDKQSFFKIEKSNLVKSIGQGYKIVEFITLDQKENLIFVEAKPKGYIKSKSIPHYENKIRDLTEKFSNSLHIFFSVLLHRQEDAKNEIGENLISADYKNKKVKCILVIKDGDEFLCDEITTDLQFKLQKQLDIYNIKLITINDVMAKELKLIS